MAQVRFMSWNIQNYGQNEFDWTRGDDMDYLNRFIAHVVNQYHVDVLGIMEVMEGSRRSLRRLRRRIHTVTNNPNWCFDVVKGSVEMGVAEGEGNIHGPADLSWISGEDDTPRHEGYAFFWNNNNLANFQMLDARIVMSEGSRGANGGVPAGLANVAALTLRGRGWRGLGPNRPPYLTAINGITAATATVTGPGTVWTNLWLPHSKKANDNEAWWDRCRRPAYVIIALAAPPGTPDAQKLVPLMIYHAPSARDQSRMSTLISGFSQELYAVHARIAGHWDGLNLLAQANAVVGGDFNVDVEEGSYWNHFYGSFHRAFGAANTAGAGMTPAYANIHANPTVVYTNLGVLNNGAPVHSPVIQGYYRSPIDEMFYRLNFGANPAPNCQVVGIPGELGAGGLLAGAPITAFIPAVTFALNHHWPLGGAVGPTGPMRRYDGAYYRLVDANSPNDWTNLLNGINAGNFTAGGALDARAAALFYRTFISDHLPMLIDFTI